MKQNKFYHGILVNQDYDVSHHADLYLVMYLFVYLFIIFSTVSSSFLLLPLRVQMHA